MSTAVATLDIGRLRASCSACGLSQLCLPAGIDGDDLLRLDAAVQQRRPLQRGQKLFEDGSTFHALFVVRSGTFKTYSTSADGEVQILGFHLPGEIIGFDALADDHHRCTAEALELASVCDVPFDGLQDVAHQVPGLHRQLLRIASREVVKDHEHLVMMGRKQAQERLAIFLRSLSDRQRRLRLVHDDFLLSMSRQDLANYLGLAIETVSRIFTRFEEMGVLSVERKRIRILDFARLDEIAGEASPLLVQQAI
ncbi:MAG: fumarate/nitrate reduction transcriptional regulator Fnr [Pseudomonadota bacterium]|nr:fumarate/nitrate reduction transcriptional regulator Fnr [Pseudomonadota bacterium]